MKTPKSEKTAPFRQWISHVRENEKQLQNFEKKTTKIVDAALDKLKAQIEYETQKLSATTGVNWSCWLLDFDYTNWSPGDFSEYVVQESANEIADEAVEQAVKENPSMAEKIPNFENVIRDAIVGQILRTF
jgi:Asp-tRNA(Asn)/Glu-tRNA(Gln) amidotransferase B subunit